MEDVDLFEQLKANCQKHDTKEGTNVLDLCRDFIKQCGGKCGNIKLLCAARDRYDLGLKGCSEENRTFYNIINLQTILNATIDELTVSAAPTTPIAQPSTPIAQPSTPSIPVLPQLIPSVPVSPPINSPLNSLNNTPNRPMIKSDVATISPQQIADFKINKGQLPPLPSEFLSMNGPNASTKRKTKLRGTSHSQTFQKNKQWKHKWSMYVIYDIYIFLRFCVQSSIIYQIAILRNLYKIYYHKYCYK